MIREGLEVGPFSRPRERRGDANRNRGLEHADKIPRIVRFVGNLPVVRLQVVEQGHRHLLGIGGVADNVFARRGLDREQIFQIPDKEVDAVDVAFERKPTGKQARGERRGDLRIKQRTDRRRDLG